MNIISNIVNRIGSLNKTLSRKGLYEFLETELSKVESGQRLLPIGSGGKVGEMVGLPAKAMTTGYTLSTIKDTEDGLV